jgi:hypothetical protein
VASFALDVVFAPALGIWDHARTSQHAFKPAVAACTRKLGPVLGVEMGHIPARKVVLVQLNGLIDFCTTGTAPGNLTQSLVQQALQAISVETFDVAAKAAFASSQQKGCLDLGQSTLAPTLIDFLKSHFPILLAQVGPDL